MLINKKQLSFTGTDGTEVKVDLSKLRLPADQQAALDKLLSNNGDLKALTKEEAQTVIKGKSVIGNGPQAFLARFDLKFVRIDE